MAKNQTSCKKKILEQLENIPIVQIAIQKAGVPRSTYYRWLDNDPDFKLAVENAQNKGYLSINDVAESKLIQKINDGEWKAISYWLESNHKKYFKPRRPIIIEPNKPGPRPIIVELVGGKDNKIRKITG